MNKSVQTALPMARPVSRRTAYHQYENELVERMQKYRASRFVGQDYLFDRRLPADAKESRRPPVFMKDHRGRNVITDNHAPLGSNNRSLVEAEIPRHKRHQWFGSMKSSQALAQSVFGNLKHLDKMSLLACLLRDDGKGLFPVNGSCRLEQDLPPFQPDEDGKRRNRLGEFEGRGTSLDVLFEGPEGGFPRVVVECKLAEQEIGQCSKANVEPTCYLTNHGIRYWQLWPQVFKWSPANLTCPSCPAHGTYQLARNVLAACVTETGQIDSKRSHAVLIYDDRNPAFQVYGVGMKAWQEVKDALHDPWLMQRCSWQEIMACLRVDPEIAWLTSDLSAKYGF